MPPPIEEDFPKGHPARGDYDPKSAEAIEWARKNVSPLGQRDFPVDHPKAADTPGNLNAVEWRTGINPHNPHLEAFTARTPEQAASVKALSEVASKAAVESPVYQPLDAFAVSEAMNKKRKALGRDILTEAEHSEVLAELYANVGKP